jgi:hypothetical protein
MAQDPQDLPEFHPQTVIRDWGNGQAFRLADALTGTCVFGATGSGKTSGPAKHLAYGYLANGFGGIVMCAKKDECTQWVQWATETGREDDLIIVDASGKWRFNFLDWEASRPGEGGGFTINIVSLLDEIASAVSNAGEKSGGDQKFWENALSTLNSNLVDLAVLAGLKVSLPLLREIVGSAATSLEQVEDPAWLENSVCAQALKAADEATAKGDPDKRADFEECRTYWTRDFPMLGNDTRSSVVLGFSILIRPLVTQPLRKLFSTTTNFTPENTFEGKLIIVNIPVQEYRLAGRIANLAMKYCFQVAVLRRVKPANGYLRPVFLWADEAQYFITKGDSEYQAVARSAGGCTVYLTQNRESFRRVLGNNDAVDSLLGNLQAKFFCLNTGDTNEWASKLLGERWVQISGTSVGLGAGDPKAPAMKHTQNSSVSRSEQRRYFVEPARFTTLKRGGEHHNFQVETIVYLGGHQFPNPDGGDELLPYYLLTLSQK